MARIEIKGEQHTVGEVFHERDATVAVAAARPACIPVSHVRERARFPAAF